MTVSLSIRMSGRTSQVRILGSEPRQPSVSPGSKVKGMPSAPSEPNEISALLLISSVVERCAKLPPMNNRPLGSSARAKLPAVHPAEKRKPTSARLHMSDMYWHPPQRVFDPRQARSSFERCIDGTLADGGSQYAVQSFCGDTETFRGNAPMVGRRKVLVSAAAMRKHPGDAGAVCSHDGSHVVELAEAGGGAY